MFGRETRDMAQRALDHIDTHIDECGKRYQEQKRVLERIEQKADDAAKQAPDLERRLQRWLIGILLMVAGKVLWDVLGAHLGIALK